MSTIGVLVTALALSMDAMSLSIYQGIASTEAQKKTKFYKNYINFWYFSVCYGISGFIVRNFIYTLYFIILKICFICYIFIFRTYDVKGSIKKRGNGVWWKILRF